LIDQDRPEGHPDTGDCGVGNEPLNPSIGGLAMLFLTEAILKAVGFKFDEAKDTWVAPRRLPQVVTVECDEDGSYVVEAMLEVHTILEPCGCTYRNFAVRGRYVSIVGLTRTQVAAMA
jgi:hypothetical protein